MSLLWACPVLVLVFGMAFVARLLDRLVAELAELDDALRRLVRIGVAIEDLRHEVVGAQRHVHALDRR